MLLREILTTREMDYVRLVAEPYSNAEIGIILKVTADYVHYRMGRLYEKLGIQEGHSKNRIMLALRYQREQLTQLIPNLDHARPRRR